MAPQYLGTLRSLYLFGQPVIINFTRNRVIIPISSTSFALVLARLGVAWIVTRFTPDHDLSTSERDGIMARDELTASNAREALSPGRYFGTDGIRVRANSRITADMALKVGQAAGLAFHWGDHRNRVVIGKDTRLSSHMIEYALVAALLPSEATFSHCAGSDAGGGNSDAPARQVYRGSLPDGRRAGRKIRSTLCNSRLAQGK